MKHLLITSGDPSGIGPEVILKLLLALGESSNSVDRELYTLLDEKKLKLSIVGPLFIYQRLIKNYKLAVSIIKDGSSILFVNSIHPTISFNVIDVPYSEIGQFTYGKVSISSGRNALDSLNKSVNFLRLKQADGVVTAPVNKASIALNKKGFVGHTEYYAEQFSVSDFSMCFISDAFNLVLLTTHVVLSRVAEFVTSKNIRQVIERGFEIQRHVGDKKELLFMGLNPHAGENGLFGSEDKLIAEEVSRYQDMGRSIVGPLPADSAFKSVYEGKYKTVITCYHDQGLIPLKMLSMGSSVNITMGLPFVRTSVDHGSAFDIAGSYTADYLSMSNAIFKAYEFLI